MRKICSFGVLSELGEEGGGEGQGKEVFRHRFINHHHRGGRFHWSAMLKKRPASVKEGKKRGKKEETAPAACRFDVAGRRTSRSKSSSAIARKKREGGKGAPQRLHRKPTFRSCDKASLFASAEGRRCDFQRSERCAIKP